MLLDRTYILRPKILRTSSRPPARAAQVVPSPIPVKGKEVEFADGDKGVEPPLFAGASAGGICVVLVVREGIEPVFVDVVVVEVDTVVVEELADVEALVVPPSVTFWVPFGPLTVNVAAALPTLVGEKATETWHDDPAARVHVAGATEKAPFPPLMYVRTLIASPEAHSSTDDVAVAPGAAASLTLNGKAPTGRNGVTWDQVKYGVSEVSPPTNRSAVDSPPLAVVETPAPIRVGLG